MLRRSVSVLGVLCFVLSIAGTTSATVVYNVTDLGTLSKDSFGLDVCSINSSGQVVGTVYGPRLDSYGFFWQVGMPCLAALDGTNYSGAGGINDSGQVAGWTDTGGNLHASLWKNGVWTQDIGTLGGPMSFANGINNNGQVVGWTGNGINHAFIWQNGVGMQNLGSLGGQSSDANGINDDGQAVGWAYTSGGYQHAFLWKSATGMQDIGTLGGSSSQASGINNNGQVVGGAFTSGDASNHAFVWQSDTGMEDIGALIDGAGSYAYGINNHGQVVGGADVSGNALHAFLWQSGVGMQDMNNMIDLSAGWTLSRANAINDNGWIVCGGTDANGTSHVLLLTPVPEPSAFVLLGISAIGIAAYAWRRLAIIA